MSIGGYNNPGTKKKSFLNYCIYAVPIYLVFSYIVCQVVKTDESLPLAERLDAGLLRVLQHPFDIFPIPWNVLGALLYVFIIVMLLVYVEYARRKQLRPGKENGSATWNTDLKKYNKVYSAPKDKPYADRSGEDNKNIIMTNNVFLSMNGRDTMRNLNFLVTGGSGSGKSRFVVKPNLLQANCSFVVTDPKGELLESTGDFLRKRGYKIKVFNLVQMEHSCSYNPFHYIRNEEGVLTMINALIKNTTPKGAMSNDPFWEKAETALLQAICFYLYYECKEEDRNFTNVMKLLRCLEVREGQEDYDSTLDIMFKMLKEKQPEHIAVRQYAVFKQAAGKTAQSIMVSCSVRLTVFNMQSITNLTATDNIDLGSIGHEKTALFCITPVVDTTFNFLVALLYTQLFETLYFVAQTQCEEKRLPIHVRFLLDEFANIGTIPEFDLKLSTMRSYEISCTIIIQNLAQLKAMYKDNWENITGNCDSFLFLGGQEQTTLEYVSKKLGKETIRTRNSSRNYGGRGGSSLSYNTTGRDLMTPDEIAKMSTSDCILFIRGLAPFFGKKYDYPKHPNYKFTGDADKSLIFAVDKEFDTKSKPAVSDSPYAAEKRKIKIVADRSESKNSTRLDRTERTIHSNPRTHSHKNIPLYKNEALEKTLVKTVAINSMINDTGTVEEMVRYEDGYAPTVDEAFSEFYSPSEEEIAEMNEGNFDYDYGVVEEEPSISS